MIKLPEKCVCGADFCLEDNEGWRHPGWSFSCTIFNEQCWWQFNVSSGLWQNVDVEPYIGWGQLTFDELMRRKKLESFE